MAGAGGTRPCPGGRLAVAGASSQSPDPRVGGPAEPSGFVGRQTVDYFAHSADVQSSGLTWALAGRSQDKLEAVRKASGAQQAGIVVAEAHDAAAMDALARNAKVVLSTAVWQ